MYKNSVIIVLIMFLSSACGDMMDIHQEFVKDGEIVYLSKPDSVKFLAGKNRVYFECVLRNAPNITSIDIFWNRGKDSHIIPVTPSTGIYKLNAWIPDLEEQSYTFEVQTSDSYGQHSLMTTGFANSYGEMFQMSLVNRPYRGFALTDRNKEVSVELSWINAAERLVWSEIRYNDKNDNTRVIRALPADVVTVCEDATVNSVFECRSAFLPETDAVDTFYTEWKRILPDPNYTLGMNGWSVTASSYQPTGNEYGPPEVILQPGFELLWHSQWGGGPVAQLPHWIEIDMQNAKSLTRIEVTRHTDVKSLHIIPSETLISDKTALKNMTPAAILEYPGPWDLRNVMRYCDFETPVSARYIYLYMPDTHRNPYACLQYIKVFGWTQ